ncbi:MAG: hydroxyisourate hydrolase [Janthinobacterium lividum]
MGKLSTHILDVSQGKPAAGVGITLYRIEAQARQLLVLTTSNADGRCSAPLLEGQAMMPGLYELEFGAGDYFAAQGVALPEPRFLDRITLAFGIADSSASYHVPLLMSPWSYSTYRGS